MDVRVPGTAIAPAVLAALASLLSAMTVLASSKAEVKEEQKQTKKALAGEKRANENALAPPH